MKKFKVFSLLAALCVLCGGNAVSQGKTVITVDPAQEGAPIQSTMYGIFFEDINFGADGGLYAELIKNRSFEFRNNLVGWLPFGDIEIRKDKPAFDQNPHYARLTFKTRNLTGTGLENEGFRGIGFNQGEKYKFSMYARNVDKEPVKVRIELVSRDNVVASAEVVVDSKNWTKLSADLIPRRTDKKGKIRISMAGQGIIDVDHISLFPENTWKGRENGLRPDLVQALYDLNPGLFRFPGGCIVEGTTLDTRYEWKKSVGPVENRPTNINRWNYTYNQSRAYDYFQSLGLGFYEYFLLAEDLGAEPLPVLSCGLACQYENSSDPHDHEYCPVEDLQPFIDDALDLIEFANGDVKTKWGKLRAEMGHPEPFNMKYIGIGNEQWGEIYPERLEKFIVAIKAKYPDMQIVGGSGPSASGDRFDYGWEQMRRLNVDLVDEHYYEPPTFFYNGATRYDNYDRNGPKVFAGEYAAHHSSRANNFDTALSEAAFMTGLERNADVVYMATYAPLFAHLDAWQWRPDLIWFDNFDVVLTPNYYVQQMYGQNPGTHVVPLTVDGNPLTGQNNLYGSAVIDKNTGEVIIKLVNSGNQDRNTAIKVGSSVKEATARVQTLRAGDLSMENTLENPKNIVPVNSSAKVENGELNFNVRAQSFSVIKIKLD
ncbi:MAG: carbohydrate binding domain-containing protein [Rikenellaceae bacterium]|nr:carbohydrate binding domain-containing protein [Rikenellaceae bacterium]